MSLDIEYTPLMGGDDASISFVTIQKQGLYCFNKTKQDDNDTEGEGITAGLVLFLGIISIINSIGIVVRSVVPVINKRLVLMELLSTLIVAGSLLAIGLGSLYFFRKKLRMLARKKSPWEL